MISTPKALALTALLLVACGDRCARGPTTTCWCPGDAVGQSTCGEDGLYGACVCPGAPVAAPPPTQRPVLMPIPNPQPP